MSGGESSSSNSTSTNSQTIDRRQTADGEAIVAMAENGDVTVNQTADGAFDLAEAAVNLTGTGFSQALDFANSTLRDTNDTTLRALDNVAYQQAAALDTVRQGFEDVLKDRENDATTLISQMMTIGAVIAGIYLIVRFN